MRTSVAFFMFFVLIICQPGQAFTTANIYASKTSFMVGISNLDLAKGFRLTGDVGLTHTLGVDASFAYKEGLKHVDMGLKFRITPRTMVPIAGRIGVYGKPSLYMDNWHMTFGLQASRAFMPFLRGHIGLSMNLKGAWSYFISGDYLVTYNTAIQVGLRRDYWDQGLGSFVVGLRTIF